MIFCPSFRKKPLPLMSGFPELSNSILHQDSKSLATVFLSLSHWRKALYADFFMVFGKVTLSTLPVGSPFEAFGPTAKAYSSISVTVYCLPFRTIIAGMVTFFALTSALATAAVFADSEIIR